MNSPDFEQSKAQELIPSCAPSAHCFAQSSTEVKERAGGISSQAGSSKSAYLSCQSQYGNGAITRKLESDSTTSAYSRALSPYRSLYAEPLQTLQDRAGNYAVARLLQAKLKVGQPNDIYEQEADRSANLVMRMPLPSADKGCGCESESSDECQCTECADCKNSGAPEVSTVPRKALSAEAVDPAMPG